MTLLKKGLGRVACPKFGHTVLSSESYDYALNTEFVVSVSMIRKKSHHSKEKNLSTSSRTNVQGSI